VKIGYSAKLRKFKAAIEQIDTEKIFLQSAQELKDLALDLNRLQLVGEGVASDGKSLGEYSKKNKRKSGRRDLYDTGAFQGGMFLDARKRPIFIGSKDEKTAILKKIYGPILGLTTNNQSEFGNEVKQLYINKVHDHIEVLKEKILL